MKPKRLLSFALSLAMVLGMIPGMSLTAGAAGETPTPTSITHSTPNGAMQVSLKIKAAQTITASDVTAAYGDTDKSVSASVTTPETGGGAISYAVKTGSEDYIDVNASTGALTINAVPTNGKAYVIATAAENDDYKAATKEIAVTISKATPTLTNISAGAITYGQALSASTVSGTAIGVNNATVTGTWAWTTDETKPAVSDSGKTEYDVTFTSSDSNYNNATGKATLTVNPKEVELDWSNTSFTYDKQSHAPTASADNLEAADEGKVSVTVTGGQTNAGEHTATASELSGDSAANYTLPAANTTTFTIAKKEVGLNWANTSFTYDGEAHAPTASATGVVSGDTCNVTVTGAQTNAGSHTATASDLSNSNYKLPSNATQSFTITPNAITATADNKSTSYKNNLAALTFTLSDGALAQGDSENSLKITASTDAKKDSPKGTYPITLAKGQDSNPNYDVTLVPGTYTINEADATITASAYNGTYDGQEHSITVTVKDEVHNIVDLVKQLFGLNNTPEATVYYSTVSVEDALNQKSTTAPTRKDVGETTVYYAVEFGGNYKAELPVTGSQTVAITRKDLTITANNQNVAYNGSFATGTDLVTCDTLVGNDELTEITLTLTNDNTIVPSDAKIMQNGEDKTQNYNISYANGTFSKSAAPAPAPAPTPTTETITIPVSGEGKDAKTTAVTVEVKNNTATVTSADIGDVLDAKDVGTVTVNVDSLPNTVDEVVLPTELVEKVAKAVADKDNDASGLEIKLPTGTVTFDAKTVAAIADKANGKDVTLHLDTVSESSLTSGQQSTVKELNALVVLDAYVTADGKRISDFSGGTATFSVPVKLADGQTAAGVNAYFVAENGEKTEIPCTYDGKNATGTVTHFSNYVVAYDVAKAQKAEEDAKAVEDTVKDLDALPAAADVKPEDKETIEKARAAYDALTDEQKAKVPADTLKKLTDAEAALKAAEPEPTPEPGKVSYDDLTEAEKKQADEIASALGVNKDTAAAMVKAAQELGVSMDTVKLSGDALAKMDVDSSDPKGSDFGKLTARATKRTSTALTLQWAKQKKADGYLIYGNKCGKGNKMKLLKTIKKNGTVKWTQKKLKKGTYYKYMVVAYKNVNGQKMPIAASVVIHVPTKGGKYTIAKSVKVTNTKKKAITKATVKKGKTFQLKASEVKDEAKKKIKQHRKVKFESSDKKIATVSAKGVVKGVKKGTATIYVYTQNGLYKTVKVTVK